MSLIYVLFPVALARKKKGKRRNGQRFLFIHILFSLQEEVMWHLKNSASAWKLLIGSSNSFSRLQLLLLLFPITTFGEFVMDSTFPLTPKFINILSNHSSVSLTYILIIFPSYLCSMFN